MPPILPSMGHIDREALSRARTDARQRSALRVRTPGVIGLCDIAKKIARIGQMSTLSYVLHEALGIWAQAMQADTCSFLGRRTDVSRASSRKCRRSAGMSKACGAFLRTGL
jgi:hypothetical protein